MGKPYENELNALPETYKWANEVSVDQLAKILTSNYNKPLIAVGSGGSFSAAEFQATLHRYFFKEIGVACTPMEIPHQLPNHNQAAVWLLSASGNNIDICRAFKHAALTEPYSLSALVGRENSKIVKMNDEFNYTNVFEYPIPTGKDGFLATNSLVAFETILYRAYREVSGQVNDLPKSINELLEQSLGSMGDINKIKETMEEVLSKDVMHVIYSPGLKSVAVDIESKFVEAGLGSVHLSDLRNFAHGRHHWFAKMQASSSVICLSCENERTLGKKTLELLPEVPKQQFVFSRNDGFSSLAGLYLSLHMCMWKGDMRRIDPGRPGVPRFGSMIYRLSSDAGFISKISLKSAAINRKLAGQNKCELEKSQLGKSYDAFVKKLSSRTIGAVVLDYDGTAVDFRGRGYPPSKEICRQITRIIDLGIVVGFATGRGKSIKKELQDCTDMPRKYWDKIHIGYYNGAIIQRLDDKDDLCVPSYMSNEMEIVCENLEKNHVLASGVRSIDKRGKQVTIELEPAACQYKIMSEIYRIIHTNNYKTIKVLCSSHSIDMISEDVSKTLLVKEISRFLTKDKSILTIGDKGSWPGNDIDLLSEECSLSVDDVSLDSDKCWNICPAGIRGTQGTAYYLSRIIKSGKSIKYK